jgi:phenylpyruvate tautomerase PptA (4-oxalocrotonate tautomerase family)
VTDYPDGGKIDLAFKTKKELIRDLTERPSRITGIEKSAIIVYLGKFASEHAVVGGELSEERLTGT